MKRVLSAVVAFAVVLSLASCWFNPRGDFTQGSTEMSRERFAQIVEAINEHDSDALKSVFSASALENNSAEIDAGVDYILSLFPEGDISWDEDQSLPSVEQLRPDGGGRAILARSMYYISSGGVDYRLFFADFTTNTIDPDNVGVYALGVGPRTDSSDSDGEQAFFHWTTPFDVDPSRPPDIYIPE